MPNDNHQILTIHQAWMDAERYGDVQSILDLCSSEIRFFPPDRPIIVGKDAVREFLQSGSDSINEIEISDIYVEVSGSLAYKTAQYLTRLRASCDKGVTTIRGNHLWILGKESSQWRVLIVAWSIWQEEN